MQRAALGRRNLKHTIWGLKAKARNSVWSRYENPFKLNIILFGFKFISYQQQPWVILEEKRKPEESQSASLTSQLGEDKPREQSRVTAFIFRPFAWFTGRIIGFTTGREQADITSYGDMLLLWSRLILAVSLKYVLLKGIVFNSYLCLLFCRFALYGDMLLF